MSQLKLNDVLLDLLISLLEKKPSLSPLFAESSSQEVKKAGDQQMSPELLNKAFQGNPYNAYLENAIRSLKVPGFQRINEVCNS